MRLTGYYNWISVSAAVNLFFLDRPPISKGVQFGYNRRLIHQRPPACWDSPRPNPWNRNPTPYLPPTLAAHMASPMFLIEDLSALC